MRANLHALYSKVYLARLNGQMKRYDAMKTYVVDAIKMGGDPSAEEQRLLSISFSKLEHALRDAWQLATSKLDNPEENSTLIENCRDVIHNELEVLCSELLALVGNDILPHTKSIEVAVFCHKM